MLGQWLNISVASAWEESLRDIFLSRDKYFLWKYQILVGFQFFLYYLNYLNKLLQAYDPNKTNEKMQNVFIIGSGSNIQFKNVIFVQ